MYNDSCITWCDCDKNVCRKFKKKKDHKKEDSESVVITNDLRSGRTFKPKALIILIMECINRGVQI